MKHDLAVIADYHHECGECPVWDAASGTLYWTDLATPKFYRYRPDADRHELVHHGFQACGFALNRGGALVVTNEEGVWLWDCANLGIAGRAPLMFDFPAL